MVVFHSKFGMLFSYEVLPWYAYQFPPELLENASTNFLICRGGLKGLKRTHWDFSRLLPIPRYISKVTQAMLQSALATADKSGWILCKDFRSVWTTCVRRKKEGRGKQAFSLPLPLKYWWPPLRPKQKTAMNWAFCGMGLDLQWGR